MSDHADTIRYAFFNTKPVDVAAADQALDALLAENQRYEKVEQSLKAMLASAATDRDKAQAENQRLQEELTTSYLRREADGLIAENQQLRDEAQRLEQLLTEAQAVLAYFKEDSDEKYATEEGARWILRYDAICEALAGDAE